MSENNDDPRVNSFRLLDRDWILHVDRYTRRDVLAATDNKVDLFGAFEGTLMIQLSDTETMVDVVWAMCKDQADDVTIERFIRAISGPIVDQIDVAMRGAIVDFFQSRQRLMLTKAMAKATEAVDKMTADALKSLDDLDPDQLLIAASSSSPLSPTSVIPAG